MINIQEFITKDNITENDIRDISEYINYNFNNISNELREKILLKLCQTEIGSDNTASTIIENFKNISDEVKNSLFNLAKNPLSSKNVSVILQYKYYTLPNDYRNKLLESLDINNESVIPISHIINEAFKNIPIDIREKIILELANYKEAEFYRLKVLKFNFDNIIDNVREKLLISISSIDKINKPVSFIVRDKVKKISPDCLGEVLLNLLSGNCTKFTTYIARDYFYLISEKYKYKVLEKLIDNYYSKTTNKLELNNLSELLTVLYIIIRGYDKYLDKSYCNNLLEKLSLEPKSIWGIVGCLIRNFDNLEPDIRNKLLINVSENIQVKDSIVHILTNKSDKIPTDIKNVLKNKLNINLEE
ncbi:MAG: hypothetical protein U0354_11460 [Candidatus Sericytochromatia bacterium]